MPSTRSPRRALTAAVALLALTTATACGADAAGGPQTKELRYQGSVGQVTLPELAADLGYLGDVRLNWIGNVTGGPADIQATATGQSDFGGAFNGAIVKLRPRTPRSPPWSATTAPTRRRSRATTCSTAARSAARAT
ncbi:hypothetical protein V2I01_25030 [Micromonospora sp. BRA006-A]|nr:hypothetical protein [Micromonospora sp. BRA006-A]